MLGFSEHFQSQKLTGNQIVLLLQELLSNHLLKVILCEELIWTMRHGVDRVNLAQINKDVRLDPCFSLHR